MNRVCFCLQVKAGLLEEYKRRHETVWPEYVMTSNRRVAQLLAVLTHDGLLIGYLETPDFDGALTAMAGTDVNRRWQTEMAHFFEGIPGKKADEQMMRLTKSLISTDRQRLERYSSFPLLSANCSAGMPI